MIRRLSNTTCALLLVVGALIAQIGIQAGSAPIAGATSPPAQWSLSQGYQSFTSVSCASSSDCWAGGSELTGNGVVGVIENTANFGGGWASVGLPTSVGSVVGVSYVSTNQTYAVSQGAGPASPEFIFPGGSGLAATGLPNADTPEAIDCNSTPQCWIGATSNSGQVVLSVTFSGGSPVFTTQSVPSLTAISAISCITLTCYVAGPTSSSPEVLTNSGGSSWSATSSQPASITSIASISCASTSSCWIAGEDSGSAQVESTSSSGASWVVAATEPPSSDVLTSISCTPSTTECGLAGYVQASGGSTIGDGVTAFTTSGSSWSAGTQGPSSSLSGVSCPSSGYCLAVGGSGNSSNSGPGSVSTADSGLIWSPSDGGSTGEFTPSVVDSACPSSSDCFGVGSGFGVQASTDSGSTWSAQSVETGGVGSPPYWLSSIGCLSTAECTAVGYSLATGSEQGVIYSNTSGCGGTTVWCSQSAPSANNLQTVACDGSTDCFAGGVSGGAGVIFYATSFGGPWSSATGVPSGVTDVTSISCTATTTCFATADSTSGPEVLNTTTGSSWSAVSGSLPGSMASVDSISCPASTTCYVAGNTSGGVGVIDLTTNSGTAWSNVAPSSAPDNVTSISCASAIACVVMSQNNIALATVNSGTNWYSQQISNDSQGLTSVTCASTTLCLVSGTLGIFELTNWYVVLGAPAVSGLAGNGSATVWWTPPSVGSAPTSYTVSVSPACATCSGLGTLSGSALSTTVTGLTNGTPYTFSVSANNIAGPGTAGTSPSLTPSAPAPSLSPTWSQLSSTESLSNVYCYGSSGQCYSVGQLNPDSQSPSGFIAGTTNAGANWSDESISLGWASSLSGIGCASSTLCFATGDNFNSTTGATTAVLLSTSNGGSSWSPSSGLPSFLSNLNAVSCISSTTCFIVGGFINGQGALLETTNAGTSWSDLNLAFGTGELNAITCPGATECIAVGDQQISGTPPSVLYWNGGTSWQLVSTVSASPSGSSNLTSVGCISTTACFATGPNYYSSPNTYIVTTTSPDVTWTESSVSTSLGVGLSGLGCFGANDCWAVGSKGQIVATSNGGSSWAAQSSNTTGNIDSVTCYSGTNCILVGADNAQGPLVQSTSSGGSTWAQSATGLAPSASSISCPSASDCIASGSYWGDIATTNGGTSWTAQPLTSGITSTGAIACPTTTNCFIGAQTTSGAAIYATSNFGSSWSAQSVSGITSINTISCPTSLICYAAGSDSGAGAIIATTNGGTSWTPQSAAGATSFSDISCPSSSECFIVGTNSGSPVIEETSTSGLSWASQSSPSGVVSLDSISCPSITACYAVGAGTTSMAVIDTTNTGTTWSAISNPSGVTSSNLTSIACTTSTNCVALGFDGTQGFVIETTNSGTNWTVTTVAPSSSELPTSSSSQISCASSSTCYLALGGIYYNSTFGVVVPSAPGTPVASVNGPNVNLSWSAPTSNGGSPITGYTVVASPSCSGCSGVSVTGSSTTTTISGLTTGTAYTFTVAAINAVGTGPASSASNSVTPSAVTITTATLPNGSVGVGYSATLVESGGTAPYTWSVATGSLPAGLTLAASTGVISGTPTTAGSSSFTVKVVDSASPANSATATLTLDIPLIPIAITTTSLPDGELTVAYSQTLSASGGTAPYTWAVTSGTLPPGLSLSSAGVISGKPTSRGTYSFVATVTDSSSPAETATASLSIVVNSNVLVITTTSLPSGVAGVAYSATLSAQGGVGPYTWSLPLGALAAGLTLSSSGQITGIPSIAVTASFTVQVTDSTVGTPNVASANFTLLVRVNPQTQGYWEIGADGGIFAFGAAKFFGSMGGQFLAAPVISAAPTPDGQGYWEVAEDGGVFAFGDAQFYGSMGGKTLTAPVIGLVPTPDGLGYWEVAEDGGIFAFGDAQFYGSRGNFPFAPTIASMAATPDGLGYWLVSVGGAVFSFGDAGSFGSLNLPSNAAPIVGMAPTMDGQGYWLVAEDGGVFAFGDAKFFGSMGGQFLAQPIVGLVPTLDGKGYWEVAEDGGIFAYGDANFFGSMGGQPLAAPVIAIAGL